MHPKYARLVRRHAEPQKRRLLWKRPSFLKPKTIRRAFAILILLIAVSWSFERWAPPSKAYAAPWSSAHNQYNQRKQLTLVNSSGQTFESGTTYKVTIDTQSLASAGSLLSTCDDLRVVYQPSDTQAVELKRALEYASSSSGVTTCATSSATKVVFQLQANIANAGTDVNYYIYYDNAQAPAYSSSDALDAYNVGSKEATFVAPFNGTTTALAAGSGNPTTATGAIRYSGGKSALSFDGKDDFVSATCTTITGPFTVEFWVNAQDHTQGANAGGIFGGISGTDNGQVGIGVEWHTSFFYDIGNWNNPARKITTPAEFGVWTHLAATYDGTFFALFKNGILVDRKQDLNGVAPTISGCGLGAASNYYKGLVDEYRVSNIVRYAANFTPTTTPFVRDDNTYILYHFDENGLDLRNTNKVVDDSGNGKHGTNGGASYVGGLIGVDSGSGSGMTGVGYQSSQSYAGHEGVFIEEGTTNKITNPSFEHATYDTNWSSNGNWWEAGGSTGVVAAYQPIGASDLANSYVNKANPGTYNAAPGVAPTWVANSGWTFNGTTQWLNTAVAAPLTQDWSMFARFSNAAIGYTPAMGVWGNSPLTERTCLWPAIEGAMAWSYGTFESKNGANQTSGIMGFAGRSEYYAGTLKGTISVATPTNNQSISMGKIGGWYGNLSIQASVIYSTTLTGDQVLALTNAMNTLGLTVSKNTSAPYYKFGSSSTKVVASADGTVTTIVNAGNTNTHTLSAYVYDGTTGNVGGTVSSSVAQLVFNGSAQTTTYTDIGGGWWRLTYSGAGIASSQSFGVQVKSGKTIYVDGVQLEEKAYATTYTDGTMGTGYAWTGTANDSTSTRQAETLTYSATLSASQGTISLWYKPLSATGSCGNVNSVMLGASGWGGIAYQPGTFRFYNGAGNSMDSYLGSVTYGNWYHILAAWNGSTATLYVNNATDGSGAISNWTPTTISIGSRFDTNTCHTNSVISDVKILSDVISSTEVADLYYSGLGSHSSLAPVATERYTDGEPPVLAWHLNEGYGTTTYDSTIYANNGTISGASFSSDSPNPSNSSKSLKFDGVDDKVSRTYSNDPELNPGATPFSVSTWFKHPSAVTGTDTLISRYSSTGSGGGYKVYMNSSGFICFGVDDDTTWGPDDSACTTISYADSTWHHVLAIKGTSTIAVYIDGTQKASTAFTVSSSLSGSTPSFHTGIDSDGTSNPWDGFIDEIRVYNSVRSEEQINQEYMARGTNKGVSAQFGSGGASDTLSTGLVGYWKMDEASWNGTSGEVLDASGNAYNGVSVNGATTTTGMFGNGGSFDGSNDYVNLPTSIGNFESFPGFTVSTWVNTTSASTRQVIYSNGAAGVVLELYSSGGLRGWLRSQGVSNQIGGGLLSANTWYLVTLTYDYSFGKARLYLNNELKATSASFIYDHGTTLRENVGACLDPDCGGNFNWSGKMDGFRIYNRALSPAEVRALYEYAPGPKVHLQLNDGTGTTAQDSSGNSNTGTLNDGASYTNGKYGKGVKLDGTNDDISVGDFAY